MSTPCKHEVDFGKLDQWQKRVEEKIDAILTQATATNGRVGRLERFRTVIVAMLAGAIVSGGADVADLLARLLAALGT